MSASAARDIGVILDGIRYVVQRLRRSSRDAERRIGLTAAQVFVLEQLNAAPDLSVNELAARTYTHQSSVSVVVSRLVRQGLVRRRRMLGDARRWSLSLSERGRRALARAPTVAQGDLIEALEQLPQQTRHTLAEGMGRLVRDMGAEGKPAMFFEPRGER